MSNSGPVETIREGVIALLSGTRFGQFASAGLVGTAIDNGVLVGLVEFADLSPVIAKVVAWEIAIMVIFAINEHWTFATFGSTDPRAFLRRFLRSNAVRLAGLLVTLGVFAGLVYGAGVWYLAANLVGISVGFVVNYTAESLYTWQVQYDER